MEGREGIQVGERSLKDTEYADDAALLAETLMALQLVVVLPSKSLLVKLH